ncbi:hypothetical protein D018_3854B, partial [Vibrio parahaemolyticus VP2007-007]
SSIHHQQANDRQVPLQ